MLTTTILFASLPGQSLWRPALQGGVPRYPPKIFGALPLEKSCSAGRTAQDAHTAERAAKTQDAQLRCVLTYSNNTGHSTL